MMIRERNWIFTVLCLSVISSGATFAAQTAKAVRQHKRETTALLQVESKEAQRHGVTPDFFDEASIESGGNFEPKASNPENVIAGVQTGAATATPGATSAASSKAVAGSGAAVYDNADAHVDHGMRLMDKATPAPPKLLIVQLHEAADTAQKVFHLFSSGARAAMHNAAPSLFSKPGEPSQPSNSSAAAATFASLGLAETSTNVSTALTAPGRAPSDKNTEPPMLGAMNFFSSALRLTDAEKLKRQPAAVHPSMMSVAAKTAAAEETAASSYNFPKPQDATSAGRGTSLDPQEWLQRKQADAMHDAEIMERERESSLEDSMGAIRQLR